jgi:NAD(P)-dependent dehydrogenase (short-subunit alcohol dehydrogenase family)
MSDPISNPFSLEGRRALVTGGSRGLGLAIAEGFAAAGAQVVVIARTESEVLAAAAAVPRAVGFAADVTFREGVPDLIGRAESEAGGNLDIIVHSAGVNHRQEAKDFDHDQWDRIIGINLTAPFMLSQELGRRQLERGTPGSHIFIGSVATFLTVPGILAYTASKSGLYGVVRNLSREWSAHGIRVNGIGPGYVATQLNTATTNDPAAAKRMLDRIPMNRFGKPHEIASAATFLASDAASYVTGHMLMVDGGWTSA